MEFAFGMVKDSFDGPMPSPIAFLPWATAVQKVVRSGTTYFGQKQHAPISKIGLCNAILKTLLRPFFGVTVVFST